MYRGIDVSYAQGKINWTKVVKDNKPDFVMMRGGFGRYKTDVQFERNYKACKANGIPCGVYHYSYATTVEQAKQEADFVVSYLKGKKFEYPIAYDVEDITMSKLSKRELTDITLAFLERVNKAGYYVILYSSTYWLNNKLDMSKIPFDVWVAQWASKVTYKGAFGMWQYTEKAKRSGIKRGVDADFAYREYPTIIKSQGRNGYTKPEPAKPVSSAKPEKKTKKKGDAVKMNSTAVYMSSTAKTPATRKSGTYYIYDGQQIKGRYRITNAKANCGKKPMSKYVTGWIKG